MSNVNISVAMCTYNGELFLAQQLESMLIQTVLPDELIVCDDGSTDQTLEILDRFAKTAPFTVGIFKNNQQPLGSTKNFEKAINLCSGEIIVLSDQDDVWMPNKIEVLEKAINGGAGLVFSDAELVNENLTPLGYSLFDSLHFNKKERLEISHNLFFNILMRRNIVTGAATAFAKKHVKFIVPISNNWIHDAWIALLISSVDKVAIINQNLFKYRQHSKNQIGARKLSLLEKIELTKRLGNKHYLTSLDGFIDIKNHLSQLSRIGGNAEVMALLDSKIEHLSARSQLMNPRLNSAICLFKELLNGRFHSFSNGWTSFFKDVVMLLLNVISKYKLYK